jgi:hypothetical protein
MWFYSPAGFLEVDYIEELGDYQEISHRWTIVYNQLSGIGSAASTSSNGSISGRNQELHLDLSIVAVAPVQFVLVCHQSPFG